jgi:hypothetical protein
MNYKDANKNKMSISGSDIGTDSSEEPKSKIPTPRISQAQEKRLSTDNAPPVKIDPKQVESKKLDDIKELAEKVIEEKNNAIKHANAAESAASRTPVAKVTASNASKNAEAAAAKASIAAKSANTKAANTKSAEAKKIAADATKNAKLAKDAANRSIKAKESAAKGVPLKTITRQLPKKKSPVNTNESSQNKIQKQKKRKVRSSKKIDRNTDTHTERQLRSERHENSKLKNKIRKLERKLSSIKVYNPVAADADSSDASYNDYITPGLLPLGAGLQSWKNDYILLNTDKWRPAINPIPHCKVEKECPVCPNVSAGYAKSYSTLKDFNKSRRVMPPDTINVDYINKLNAGK